MGQLAVKIKQMAERLEWNNENKSSMRLSKSLQTSTTDLDVAVVSKEKRMLRDVLSKLELIETVVENQSQIIGGQQAKLQALENTVKSAHEALETLQQKDTATGGWQDNGEEEDLANQKSLSRIFDSIFQEKSKPDEETAILGVPPSNVLQEHTDTLYDQEQRLTAAIEKIEIIWDTMVNMKDRQSLVKDVENELQELKTLVQSLRRSHDALKTESHDELQTQQKILDNMFSGFIVAFLLLVFICMFHK